MTRLGDLFSKEVKEELASIALTPGSIIRCLVNNTDPPKEKFFVVINKSQAGETLGVVYINSRIHPYILKNPELHACQLLVKPEDHNFLHHESFVDCTNISKLPYDEIVQNVAHTKGCIKGNVNKQELEIIHKLLQSSPKTSKHDLKSFGIIV